MSAMAIMNWNAKDTGQRWLQEAFPWFHISVFFWKMKRKKNKLCNASGMYQKNSAAAPTLWTQSTKTKLSLCGWHVHVNCKSFYSYKCACETLTNDERFLFKIIFSSSWKRLCYINKLKLTLSNVTFIKIISFFTSVKNDLTLSN